MNYKNKKLSSNSNLNKPNIRTRLLLAILALLIIAGLLGGFWRLSHKPVSKSEATASVDTKGEMLDSVKNRGEAVTTSPTRSSQSPTAPNPTPIPPQSPKEDSGTSGILIDPTGTYVNNHHVSLTDGQSLQSTCNTSPRATCQIVFTKNDIVKTLQTKQTDSGGAAYWTWSLQSIGLTPGSWIIRTKATLGTQTKQANDALNLEVAP